LGDKNRKGVMLSFFIYNISIRLGQEAYDALAIFFGENMKEYKTVNQQLTIVRVN